MEIKLHVILASALYLAEWPFSHFDRFIPCERGSRYPLSRRAGYASEPFETQWWWRYKYSPWQRIESRLPNPQPVGEANSETSPSLLDWNIGAVCTGVLDWKSSAWLEGDTLKHNSASSADWELGTLNNMILEPGRWSPARHNEDY